MMYYTGHPVFLYLFLFIGIAVKLWFIFVLKQEKMEELGHLGPIRGKISEDTVMKGIMSDERVSNKVKKKFLIISYFDKAIMVFLVLAILDFIVYLILNM